MHRRFQATMEVRFKLLLSVLLLHLVNNAREAYGFFHNYDLHSVERSSTDVPVSPSYGIDVLNRSSFPAGFIFGASSSAYQIEGGWNSDGKGLSNWDHFTHKFPEKIIDRNSGDVAADSYHLYKEDVKLLKNMNADAYRFSVSWARLLPSGKLSGGINQKGIQYYNNLIDELISNGLKPTVTIFHWDIPQALEYEYGGFLSENVVKDFHDYADLCFKSFGDRVKLWITLNEPFSYSYLGYGSGDLSPGRCSAWMNKNCSGGNSGTEPYIVAHNQLLVHADVVQLYRTKYQKLQKGKIGISLPGSWATPLTNSSLDYRASIRFLDFTFGWFMNPIVYGDYPANVQKLVGKRMPKFTPNQSKLLTGSFDFLGFNYYTGIYVSHLDNSEPPNPEHTSFTSDIHAIATYKDTNGKLIGEQLGTDWLHEYPVGLWKFLLYIKRKYKNPLIYITENGVLDGFQPHLRSQESPAPWGLIRKVLKMPQISGACEANNPNLSLEAALQDSFRIKYYFKHLASVKKAIEHGVRIKGFYGWAIIDTFEWYQGYTVRFGIHYVDYKTLIRYPKLSAKWFKKFLQM